MPNITKITKKRLGEILVNEGLITNEQIQEGLSEQQKSGGMLGENLIKLGYITELDIAAALSTQFGLPYIDVTQCTITKETLDLLPMEFMNQYQFVILDKIGSVVTIAISSPVGEKVFEEIEKKTSCQVFAFVSTGSQIKQAIQLVQGQVKKKP
jgi:type IV pilus assembly protein PilB